MDNNKLKVLKEIDYSLSTNCGNCDNSFFKNKNVVFGVCKLHRYKHEKHTESERELSISKDGLCRDHVLKFSFDMRYFQSILCFEMEGLSE